MSIWRLIRPGVIWGGAFLTILAFLINISYALAATPAERGKDIFIGKVPLKNGGPACLSCHNISGISAWGGGTMGKELTKAYSLLGDQGIIAILKATPFPAMREIYGVKPLTDDEIANLTAFLKESSEKTAESQNRSVFLIVAAAGTLILIGIFQLIWKGRLSQVRRPMIKGGSK